MQLNQRLTACATFVRPQAAICDIGTDHAQLPCFLMQEGIVRCAIAADINPQPLARAKQTIQQAGLESKVIPVLSNGLQNISQDQADDIIIAGMGGQLIAEILLACPWHDNPQKRYILQPMTNAAYLRRHLYKHRFMIIKEQPVFENGHHYSVLLCQFCGEKQTIDDLFALAGKIPELPGAASAAYLYHQAKRMQTIADGYHRSKNQGGQAQQYQALSEQLSQLAQRVEIAK